MAEKGMGFAAIAKATGLTVSAIGTRSSRDQWMTPARRAAALAGEGKDPATASDLLALAENVSLGLDSEAEKVIRPKKKGGYVETLADKVQLKVLRALMVMPDPKTWRDLNTADMMVRRALGLDKNVSRTTTLFNPETGLMGIRQEVISHNGTVENEE